MVIRVRKKENNAEHENLPKQFFARYLILKYIT